MRFLQKLKKIFIYYFKKFIDNDINLNYFQIIIFNAYISTILKKINLLNLKILNIINILKKNNI